MKLLRTLLILPFILPALGAEEFIHTELSGEQKQHRAVTHFFFQDKQCYGARREYSNLRMHVVRPKIYWDLYYDGVLVATVDPEARSIDYVRAPEGTVLTKHLSRFSLSKDDLIVRVWDLEANQLNLLPAEELARLNHLANAANEQYSKLIESYGPQFGAPSHEEATSKMKKAN